MKEKIIIKAYPVSKLFLKSLFKSFIISLIIFFILIIINLEIHYLGLFNVFLLTLFAFLLIQFLMSFFLKLREKTKEIIVSGDNVIIVRRGSLKNVVFNWQNVDSVKEIENKLLMKTMLYLDNGEKISVWSNDFDMENWKAWNDILISKKNLNLQILDR